MKLVLILCLAMVLAACNRDQVLTQDYYWTEKQLIAAIDQNPDRQDTWVRKQTGPDTFLVMDRNGKYIKR